VIAEQSDGQATHFTHDSSIIIVKQQYKILLKPLCTEPQMKMYGIPSVTFLPGLLKKYRRKEL
jgi:hypothetical protein